MSKYLKTTGQFWWECCKLSTKLSYNIFLEIATIIGFLTAIVSCIFGWGKLLSILVASLPFAAFVLSFISGMLRYSHKLYKVEADKVKQYETQDLELLVEDTDQYFRRRGNSMICRVGLRTSGVKAINNVSVALFAWDGNQNAFSDEPLNPTDAQILGVSPCFIIKPGETKFVEVLAWDFNNNTMGIIYYKNYQIYLQSRSTTRIDNPFKIPQEIPCGNHILILYATGNDIMPVQRDFIVELKDNKLSFT